MDFRMTSKQMEEVTAILAACDPDLAEDFGYLAVNLLPRSFIRVADFLRIRTHGISSAGLIDVMRPLSGPEKRAVKRIIFDK